MTLFQISYLKFVDKPHNPMLNSGAMMTSAIVSTLIEPSMKNSEKFDYVLQYMKVHVIQLTVKIDYYVTHLSFYRNLLAENS